MKKVMALFATMIVVLSMTCVCMAKDDKVASCGATYHKILHYQDAYVKAPEDKVGCYRWIHCELWNSSSRYSDYDGHNEGKYISTTFRKQTAKTKSHSNSTRGYAIMYLKDSNGNYIKEGTRKGKFYTN